MPFPYHKICSIRFVVSCKKCLRTMTNKGRCHVVCGLSDSSIKDTQVTIAFNIYCVIQ